MNKKENYHRVDLRHQEWGIVGVFHFHKDLYDQLEVAEISEMLTRVLDSWWRRRQFMHQNPQKYYCLQ